MIPPAQSFVISLWRLLYRILGKRGRGCLILWRKLWDVPGNPVPSGLWTVCPPVRLRRCKVPVQARFRSDKYAAVLRLQRTQPKDRSIYTAFTGILAVPQPHRRTDSRKPDGTGFPGTGEGCCNFWNEH